MAYIINQLSVFFPAYNEEANLENTVNKTIPILKDIAQKWEIIIINDGSKDNTEAKAKALIKKYPKYDIKLVNHHPNRGYGAAFKSGIYNAKYDWITFTDADGQFDFNDIKDLISTQKKTKADLVIGYYLNRQVSKATIITSKMWELVIFLLFGLKVRDIDCAFKLFKKEVVDTIPKLEAERGAFISSEFLIKSKKAGFKISQVGVHHYPRIEGKATGRNIKVIIKSFSDLLKLWFRISFHHD